MEYCKQLSEEFKIKEEYAQNIINLLDEGNTIPFIARYRKEMHGTLDDQTIREISERLGYLRGLGKRREEIFGLISGLEKMDDEIAKALDGAKTLAELEDIYRPFKPKRKTRASVAKEKGLEPLADMISAQDNINIGEEAQKYIDVEKGVESVEDAVQGAMDIIAENISDNAEIRKRLKSIIRYNAYLVSKAVDPEKDSVYTVYYDYRELVSNVPGHRVLAVDRGEKEEFLKVGIEIEADICLGVMQRFFIYSYN